MTKDRADSYRSFPTTRWTTIFQAAHTDEERRRAALERLMEQYVPALRAHLVFEKGLKRTRADDIVQGFVADKILEKDLIRRVDREKGKFRSFLLRALNNYLISVRRWENAEKRAPNRAQSLGPDHHDEMQDTGEPSYAFELAWARQVLTLTLQRMESYCRTTQQQKVWGVFRCRVLRPILDQEEALSYEEIIEKFEFDSPRQASNALVTAKRMFKRNLREVVGEYTEKTWDIEAEIQDLREILHKTDAGCVSKLRK